jgi:hypothetical protein
MGKDPITPVLSNTPQAAALWGVVTRTVKDNMLAQGIAPGPVNPPCPPMFHREVQEQAIASLGARDKVA